MAHERPTAVEVFFAELMELKWFLYYFFLNPWPVFLHIAINIKQAYFLEYLSIDK